jgi:hypothetical protein
MEEQCSSDVARDTLAEFRNYVRNIEEFPHGAVRSILLNLEDTLLDDVAEVSSRHQGPNFP